MTETMTDMRAVSCHVRRRRAVLQTNKNK